MWCPWSYVAGWRRQVPDCSLLTLTGMQTPTQSQGVRLHIDFCNPEQNGFNPRKVSHIPERLVYLLTSRLISRFVCQIFITKLWMYYFNKPRWNRFFLHFAGIIQNEVQWLGMHSALKSDTSEKTQKKESAKIDWHMSWHSTYTAEVNDWEVVFL